MTLSGAKHEARGGGSEGKSGRSGPGLTAWRLSRRRLSSLRHADDALREEPGDIEALGASIARHGLLVPVLIEPDGTVRAGGRRVEAMRARASASAASSREGREGESDPEVECLVLPPGADPAVAQVVENVQRKELTPVEEARAYRALIEGAGWTRARLACEIGVARSRVTSRLNLLEAPPHVQAKVVSGEASSWVVADAFSRKGRRDGRAAEVSERLGRGGKVNPRYTPASVRVPAGELPGALRAKVFRDRVEITVTLMDDTSDLSGVGRIADAVRARVAAAGSALLAALRAARRKACELEGLA
jgi:ParB-like chromosome segregation protein Spo0J